MSSVASQFEDQLELLRTEAEGAVQFFYAWDATHAAAARDKNIFNLLNEAPLFWNTMLGALQATTLVTLGRLFDPNTANHSATRLLTLAHANPSLFTKAALADRKRALSPNADEWLPAYLLSAHEPVSEDFRRLKAHLDKRRKTYEAIYKPLRHQVFAHRAVTTKAEVGALFAKTNLRELRELLVFLPRIHETLWQLYFNGQKPRLRPARSSIDKILDLPSPRARGGQLQVRMAHEAGEFLKRHSRDA